MENTTSAAAIEIETTQAVGIALGARKQAVHET